MPGAASSTPGGDAPAAPSRRARALSRALRVLAPVEPREAPLVALLMLTVFLVLAAYYLLKPVRDGLLLSAPSLGLRGGALKTAATAAMAALLLLAVPVYARASSRVSRIRLITGSYVAVLATLGAFYVAGRAGVSVGLPFYLWMGMVNVFLVGQFWSYATDLFGEAQGKRVLPAVAVGGSAGAIVGPRLALVADAWTAMLIAGAVLAACVGLLRAVERHGGFASAGEPLLPGGGFALVRRDRYLGLIAALIVVANVVNTVGELLLASAASELASRAGGDVAARRAVIQGFYGQLHFWVNLVGLAVQALVVSRAIAWLGVRALLFVLPAVALTGYGLVGAVGGVALIRAAKIAENGTDYSLQNTVRQALFLPVTREARYKAKVAIDTFFVRLGDLLAAGVVALLAGLLALPSAALAVFNVGLAVAWLALARALGRRHRALVSGDAVGGAARTGYVGE